MHNKKGFNLAEVLITLAIIGVVASMTIPALVTNIQRENMIASLKKSFSDFSLVAVRIMSAKNGSLNGEFTSNNILRDKFARYMSYTKLCNDGQTIGNCWHNYGSFYLGDGAPITSGLWSNDAGMILNNGVLVQFYNATSSCSKTSNCGYIWIDVNGFDGPNVCGKDLFNFIIYSNRISPDGNGTACSSTGYSSDCTAYYLTQ